MESIPTIEIVKAAATVIRPLIADALSGKKLKTHETQLLLLYGLTEASTKTNQEMLLLRKDFEVMANHFSDVCKAIQNVQIELSYLKGRGEGSKG